MARNSPSPATTPKRAAKPTGGSNSSCAAPNLSKRRKPRWKALNNPRQQMKQRTAKTQRGPAMNRTEFVITTAIILFVAFCLGWFANWLVHRFTRVSQADMDQLERMSQELHEAEETRDQAITYLQQREAELTNQLAQTEAELSAAMEGLRDARQDAEQMRAQLDRMNVG